MLNRLSARKPIAREIKQLRQELRADGLAIDVGPGSIRLRASF